MTRKLTSDERLVKILSETQATIMEHNSRCVRGSVEVDARLFESMIMELQERRKAEKDSEPVAWTWHYREQWHVTNDEGRARDLAWDGVKVESLYRHAQPAPVVGADLLHAAASAIEDLLTTKDRTGAGVWFDLPAKLRRAAVLTAAVQPVPDDYQHLKNVQELYHTQEKRLFKIAQRIKGTAFDKYSHSPSQAIDVLEVAIFGEDESCRAAMLAAAPTGIPMNSNGWIPVSERMPETDGNYWGWWSESKRQGPVWFIKSELQAQFQSHEITHWMPLPAAPQEVK